MKVIILAGGGGTRLWPLSRHDFPKQFLHFGDHVSLLQKTVGRFLKAPFAEEILIATNEQYRSLVEKQLEKVDPEKRAEILMEPARRNTAPSIALAVKYLQEKKGVKDDEAILVIPSDHLIEPESVFLRFLEEAEAYVKKGNQFVLFGIRPKHPETGYGYIQIGAKADGPFYRAERFVEKPDLRKAKEYLANGNYYWNAGIFAFPVRLFWEQLKQHAAEIHHKVQGNFDTCLVDYPTMPDVSLDYALLEKTKQIAVCPLPIDWSDIGCWDSVYEVLKKDEYQNVKIGNVLDIETKNSLIFGGRRLISTIGLEDILVVETEDATFISKKGESQKVKQLVQRLAQTKQGGQTEHVKQIYTNQGFSVFSYRIKAKSGFSRSVLPGNREQWVALKGEVKVETENEKSVLSFGKLLGYTGPQEVKIQNDSDEMCEILLIVPGSPDFLNE